MTDLDDRDELAAHLRDAGELREETRCGIRHARSYEAGDNGGCEDAADYACCGCGLPICAQHAWWGRIDGVEGNYCDVCFGIEGYERAEGELTRCVDPRCGEPAVDDCEFCGKSLCAGGIYMHHIIGCTLASRAEEAEAPVLSCANCGDTSVAVQCDSCREWQCADCWRYGRHDARLCVSCAAANSEEGERHGG